MRTSTKAEGAAPPYSQLRRGCRLLTPVGRILLRFTAASANLFSMIRVAAVVTVCLASSIALAPAPAGADRGTVVVATADRFVIVDSAGDAQPGNVAGTRAERRAADIKRVRVWRGRVSGFVRVTVMGDVGVQQVRSWRSTAYLGGRRPHTVDPIVIVEFKRARAWIHAYPPVGPETTCRVGVDISNGGRTLTARVPRLCKWRAVSRVLASAASYRRGGIVASDDVGHRSRLLWN